MEEWHRRLRSEMKAQGLRMSDMRDRTGINYDRINSYYRGKVKQPRGDDMKRMSNALGKPDNWLRDGPAEIDVPLKSQPRSLRPRVDKTENPRILELDFWGGSGGGPGMDTFGKGKMEGGLSVYADAIRDEWLIPANFMRGQLRVNPRQAWIIEVYGDSMYDPGNPAAPGSLFPGDRVIIDTGDTSPSPPGPFAVHDGVGLVIKLVEVVPQSEPVRLRLSSRNQSYRAYEVTEDEARILGRVRGRISAM